MAVYTVRLQNVSGPDVVSLTDGTTYATLAVNPSVGPRGAGWTGVSYATGTGRFTFTSNDGLGYISDDIRVGLDADLLDGQHGSYYTSYTDTAIANLIDTAPATLDTLNELAAALGDDPNFATTVTNNIATKVSKAGDTMTGNLSFGDNNKAIFGAGSDLQIYHTGSNSVIEDLGTGNLVLQSNGTSIKLQKGTTETLAEFVTDGAVDLYYNNSKRLATTSTGVDVTGTVTADGLTVDGNATIRDATSPSLRFLDTNAVNSDFTIYSPDGVNELRIKAGSSAIDSLSIASSGDISFYDSLGTSQKLFWDASAERLGIGSIAPSEALTVVGKAVLGDVTTSLNQLTINGGHVADGGNDYGLTISSFEPAITLIDRSTGAGSVQLFGTNNGGMWIRGDTANDGTIGHTANTTDFMVAKFEPINTIFYTNGAESMRIDSSGRVGVGETTPSSSLHITENEITAYNGAATDGQLGAGSSLFLRQDGGSDTALSQIVFQPRTGYGYNRIVNSGGSAPYMAFATNNAERARIDASGNLLVGTTSINPHTGTSEGVQISNDRVHVSRSGGPATELNRANNDGDIAVFRKDGTTVGSIAVEGADLVVGTGNAGIRFYDQFNTIIPRIAGGGGADATVSLGHAAHRFKDLYLSGGVYLGGTGAANYLDDYEEGTWTPVTNFNGFSQSISSLSQSTYVKIGKIVHITFAVNLSASGYASSYSLFAGLPFSSAYAGTNGRYAGGSISSGGDGGGVYVSGTSIYLFPSHNISPAGWTTSWNVSASYLTL